MPLVRLGPIQRQLSPSGASTLMTSAPMSPSVWVANGPSTTVVRSITRMPASGPPCMCLPLNHCEERSEAAISAIAPARGRFGMILTGDVNLMNIDDWRVPFARVHEEFRAADIVFSNLECCLYD